MNRPSLLAAAVSAVLPVGGCFSPSYGPGGFACQQGVCPAGYVCVTEAAGKFCRKAGGDAGTRIDARGSDARLDVRRGDGKNADAPLIFDCTGKPDGTDCSQTGGKGFVCIKGQCKASTCGDKFVDVASGEECDDGNTEAADGCDGCKWICKSPADCDDKDVCNGAESCDLAKHTCGPGTPTPDGKACQLPNGGGGVCQGGVCSPAGCGNKIVESGEECDDGNKTDGDGCNNDCKYSCHFDSDCDDKNPCNGVEGCIKDVAKNLMLCKQKQPPLVCNDNKACTSDSCDPVKGCVFTPIDMDKDGKSCDEDCDDNDPTRYTGAAEGLDGKDNDCDGAIDEPPLANQSCWPDPDHDSYAAAGSTPASVCGGCPAGYTSRDPNVVGQADCMPYLADGHPLQQQLFSTAYCKPTCSFDYDCDGTETRRYTALAGASCVMASSFCLGSGWVGTVVPACGVEADYKVCSNLLGKCSALLPQKRKQECR
jgi:cysteine-rich repeat protein